MEEYISYPITELPLFFVENCAALSSISEDSQELLDLSGNIDSNEDDAPPNFEHPSITESNKRNTLVGNLGEEIAKAYLKTKYKAVRRIALEKSGEGYDIIANGHLCFEVKTSMSKGYEFEITINELRKANEQRNNYHIFYISIDKFSKIATGFIFCNPFEVFCLNFDSLVMKRSIFEPIKFHGYLQEYLYLAEKVDLTDCLLKVLAHKPKYGEELFVTKAMK